jgi:hypothetical protein
MVASHPNMFQQSTVDESEILKLVENCFLPNCAVLQWRPAKGEDIPTLKKWWCFLPSSSVDPTFLLVTSSVVFSTTMKSS